MTMPRRKAFTLLELLVAVSIFAVVVLSLYATFSSGIQLNRRMQNVDNLYGEVRWTVESLSGDLENMVDYRRVDSSKKLRGGFVGGPDKLSFFLPTEEGLKLVRYAVLSPAKASRHEVIIRRSTSKNVAMIFGHARERQVSLLVRDEGDFKLPEDADEEALFSGEILSSHVVEGSLKFSYAYLKKDQTIDWRDEWSEPFLPAGVRLEAVFQDPNGTQGQLPVRRDFLIPKGSWGEGEA